MDLHYIRENEKHPTTDEFAMREESDPIASVVLCDRLEQCEKYRHALGMSSLAW